MKNQEIKEKYVPYEAYLDDLMKENKLKNNEKFADFVFDKCQKFIKECEKIAEMDEKIESVEITLEIGNRKNDSNELGYDRICFEKQ